MTTIYNQFDGECPLATPATNKEYYCTGSTKSRGFTKLMKWVLLTKKNPNFEKKIKNYLKKNKNEINVQNTEGWT